MMLMPKTPHELAWWLAGYLAQPGNEYQHAQDMADHVLASYPGDLFAAAAREIAPWSQALRALVDIYLVLPAASAASAALPVQQPNQQPSQPEQAAPYLMPDDCDQPWVADIYGRHEVWKRQMYLDLWRCTSLRTGPCMIDLRDLGLTASSVVQQHGPLFPLSPDLCAAARRIGFDRLALAAMPGIKFNLLDWVYTEHAAAVELEARRRVDLQPGAHEETVRAETRALYDLGPRVSSFRVPEGRVLQALNPLVLTQSQE